MKSFYAPHWIPLHRGHYTKVWDPNLPRNEAGLMAFWGPDVVKVVSMSEQIPYLEDIPVASKILMRNFDVSENNPGGRKMTSEADARSQGQRASESCERTATWAEAHGCPRSRLWFEGRNEPEVWAGEPYPLVAAYYHEMLRNNQARGLHTCVGNFGAGWPPDYSQPGSPVNWDPFMIVINQMQPDDRLGLHAYWGKNGVTEGFAWLAGRWLQRPFRGVKIWLTECGSDWGVSGQPGGGWMDYDPREEVRADRYIKELAQFEQLCRADPDIEAAMIFTMDGAGQHWAHFETLSDEFMNRFIPYVRAGVTHKTWGDQRTDRWQWLIGPFAGKHHLPNELVATIVALESGGDPYAVAPNGKTGLMQALPGEKAPGRPPALQLKNPEINLDLGCKLLSDAVAHFNGGSTANPTQDALRKGVAAYAVGIPVVEAEGIENPDAKQYLGMFRSVWSQLWPGVDCPIGPGELIATPGGPGTTPGQHGGPPGGDEVIGPHEEEVTPGGQGTPGGQVTPPETRADVPEALRNALIAAGKANQILRLNPSATLQARILKDGFVPTSNEFDVVFNGKKNIGQRADNPTTGASRVYFCEAPNFQSVNFVE